MAAKLLKQKKTMEAAKREHELELARLGQEHNLAVRVPNREDRAKTPKLPSSVDGRDDLDEHLQRFERFATNAKWEKTGWATKLSALLSGRALDVYSRLSEEASVDYDQVKLALMKTYDLTEDGYRRKFRLSKPESDDSPDQFIIRLTKYLMRWIELSKTTESFEGLRDLIVKEQFINSCPKELAVHLRERAPENLDQIAKIADQYLEAHGKYLFNPVKNGAPKETDDDESERTLSDSSTVRCFKYNGRGHKSFNCQNRVRRCYVCNKQGHEARNCKSSGLRPGGQTTISDPVPRNHISAGCLVQSPLVRATKEELESCIRDNQLMLACGKSVPVVSSVCVQPLAEARMPVVKGKVYTSVNVLRDTGCSGVVVKKDLVTEDQYIGEYNHMVLIDGTVRKVPVARIYVDTPYLTGIVEAQCLSHIRSTILSLVMCQVLEQQTTLVILRRPTQIKGVQRSNLNHPRMLLQIKVMHQKLVEAIKGSESVECVTCYVKCVTASSDTAMHAGMSCELNHVLEGCYEKFGTCALE